MNNFIRVLYFAKPYWIYAVFNIIFNILAVIFSLVSITMIIPFLGLLFGTQDHVVSHCSARPIWREQVIFRCGNVRGVAGHDGDGELRGGDLQTEGRGDEAIGAGLVRVKVT